MKKNILILGSSGFIGSEVFKVIKNLNDYETFRYSTSLDQQIDNFDVEKTAFDVLVFASGIHANLEKYKNLFIENKKILRILIKFIKKTKKCIFISSFKTSIKLENKIIEEKNIYNCFKYDSIYGKVKIISEKISIKLFKENNINYKIICPSHVIGPSQVKNNPNNLDVISRSKKIINFVPNCYISLIDVRDVANYILNIINNKDYSNNKVILNTNNILFKEYVKKIRKNKLSLILEVNDKIIFLLSKFIENFYRFTKIKLNILNMLQINYILSKKIAVIRKDVTKNFTLEKTLEDIV
jgi:nucleoside-diphosphate-sugar epimerase